MVRINKLAKDLGFKNSFLIEKCQEYGFVNIKHHANALTDEQVDQITTIMEASRGLRDPIIQQVRDGSLTRQEARQQMQSIRENTKSQVEAVLTSDQLTAFEELRSHHGRQFNRRPLSEILNLTDDQQAQVESVMKGIREQMLAIREQVEAEELTREDARGQIQEIRESEIEGLSAILDEDQLTKFQRICSHINRLDSNRIGTGQLSICIEFNSGLFIKCYSVKSQCSTCFKNTTSCCLSSR